MKPRMLRRAIGLLVAVGGASAALVACSGADEDGPALLPDRRADAASTPDVSADASTPPPAPPTCATRIEYGVAWMHGPNHPESFDVADEQVTWDGACAPEGENSVAVLSNGWRPIFRGKNACVIAFDYAGGACKDVVSECASRVSYGASWMPGPNHPARYDDAVGRVYTDGRCFDDGANSYGRLSNGWVPAFRGNGACDVSLRYEQCGGLYANPVIPTDCPDPGVSRDGDTFILTCTSGGAPNTFPIYTSRDLVHWAQQGHVFPQGKQPSWGTGDWWAPEIHKVAGKFLAVYSARHQDGRFALGVASATSATGPYADLGKPLLQSATSIGLIDASVFVAKSGEAYLLWKEDGNAVGKKTPIVIQRLAVDGLSVVGSPKTILTNDQAWEGPLVEGPYMVEQGGMYYLFFSGQGYDNPNYALSVARASSPLGPFTKLGSRILRSGGGYEGPGHGSVVQTPSGDWYVVYHAWLQGKIRQAPGRVVLIDHFGWADGWPKLPLSPSSTSRPLPVAR